VQPAAVRAAEPARNLRRFIVGQDTKARAWISYDSRLNTNGVTARAASGLNPLNVLFFGNLPPHQGGSALSAAMLLPRLAASGFRVRSLAPVTPRLRAATDAFDAQHPQLGARRYEVSRMIINPAHPSAAEWVAADEPIAKEAFRHFVAESLPDVVLLGRETFVTSADPVLAQLRIPSVLRVTGSYLLTALSGGFSQAHGAAVSNAAARLNSIVVQGAHYLEFLQAHGLPNVSLIPNGVDLELFSPGPADSSVLRRWGVAPESFVALHISNMKELKRPLDIVESMGQVLAAEPQVVYVFVGEGPLLAQVRREVSARGLDHAVRFEPWAEPDAVVRYLRSASAVIMPSEFEHQSRVCLEAQSCGRLLLASDIPGAREIVVDGETGFLFRRGDPADLADKTIHAVRHPELAESIGRRARQVVQSHSADWVALQFKELLERVAAGGLAPAR
jgi:glycosyltransferase involved in cell wall biosynthesis